jgi:hypothetical protein
MHPKALIIGIILLIILPFVPIVLIEDIKNSKKADAYEQNKHIRFAIKGIKKIYQMKNKSFHPTDAIKRNQQKKFKKINSQR